MNRKIRRGYGTFMGMDVLILYTIGRRSGRSIETPLAYFADGTNARLLVASGGGEHDPDWHRNLMAHPDEVAIELPGRHREPVVPSVLEGADREHAWQRIVTAVPRYAKYQNKSERQYPVIRLVDKKAGS
ncbi:nitroreductase family deazaflavin-dependent oxidoreductase [Antrihabitans cavernicola]|nr:nitroreductase family deazaflavin-dependent oxidoreductase [Spelaeibacter cavernicola]